MPRNSPSNVVRAAVVRAALLLATGSAAAAPTYQLVDLGPHTLAQGLNADGTVAGALQEGTKAAVYRQGVWTPLAGGQTAYAVNAAGEVAGIGLDRKGTGLGFVWAADGTAQQIAPVAGDTVVSSGAISRDGVAVGTSVDMRHRVSHCFHWQAGITTAMPSPGDTCNASGINRRGQIAGTMNRRRGGTLHAFAWQDGRFKDLGTFGGDRSLGVAINERGHVLVNAQYASVDGLTSVQHAAIFRGGRLVDIGALPGDIDSQAFAINNRDEVVGLSFSLDGIRTFVYTGGQMLPLDTLVDKPAGFGVGTPTGINDAGAIVGFGSLDGVNHAYMLVPVTN